MDEYEPLHFTELTTQLADLERAQQAAGRRARMVNILERAVSIFTNVTGEEGQRIINVSVAGPSVVCAAIPLEDPPKVE